MNIKENIQVLKNAFEKGNLFPYYVLDIKTNKPSLIITFLSPVFLIGENRKKTVVEVYDNFMIKDEELISVSDNEIEEKYKTTEKIYDAFNDFKKLVNSGIGIVDIMTSNKFLCYGKSNSENVNIVRDKMKQKKINSVCVQYQNAFFSFIHVKNRNNVEEIVPEMEREILLMREQEKDKERIISVE